MLLLDINLPDGSGFDLLEQLDHVPQVIFTTAHDHHAVEAFEVNALDYLLKPIRQETLDRAISRLRAYSAEKQSCKPRLKIDSRLFVKNAGKCFLIELSKISLISSCGNYAQLYFNYDKAFVYKTMTKIEARLPNSHFIRISRQHIVNVNFVSNIESWPNGGFMLTMTDGKEIEVSRRYASQLKDLLSL